MLIRLLWNRDHENSDTQVPGLSECIDAVRLEPTLSSSIISPDPFAFSYVLTRALDILVPKDVIPKHKEEIHGVMIELSEVLTILDGSSWSYSYKECAWYISFYIRHMGLVDEHLAPRIQALVASLRRPETSNQQLGPRSEG